MAVLLAQMTDFHVGAPGSAIEGRYGTTAKLHAAVDHLLALDPRPDALLCTGDLVDAGSPPEYARLAEVLDRVPMPYYLITGNHDDREHLRAAFPGLGYLPRAGFLQYTAEVGALRLIALDTNVPGESGGQLCEERLAWLDDRLAEQPHRATVVIMHHPPFATGIAHMDGMGLDGIDRLAEVIGRHPQVERILCGHLHRPIVKRFAGTVASTCPSTTHQVELDLRSPGRLAIVGEPTACMLHFWTEEHGLVSHTSYIGDYGKPRVLVGM